MMRNVQRAFRNDPPKWAGAPTFADAYRAAERWDAAWDDTVRRRLVEARVVGFARSQVEAIPPPSSTGELDAVLLASRLPFDPVYLDTGCAHGHLAGALCYSCGPGIAVWPVLKHDGQCHLIGSYEHDGRRTHHVIPSDDESGAILAPHSATWALGAGIAANLIVALLEHPRAEMVEGGHVSRQERRAATRKNRPIALSVVIRPSQARSGAKGRTGDSALSHRFDRRGHWAHYGRETKLGAARPELLRDWPGHPDTRRVWHPPTVVGPEHLAYVPKRFFVAPPVMT